MTRRGDAGRSMVLKSDDQVKKFDDGFISEGLSSEEWELVTQNLSLCRQVISLFRTCGSEEVDQ